MPEKNYLSVDEVAHAMGISKSYAYKIVRKLNAELDKLGFLTVSGRVNRQYFMERTCYGTKEKAYKSFHVLSMYLESKGVTGIIYPCTRTNKVVGKNLVLFKKSVQRGKRYAF